ncbi:MAG: putative dehydrogenase [Lentimonas sp.]|jgi:predicted dehydrogenase
MDAELILFQIQSWTLDVGCSTFIGMTKQPVRWGILAAGNIANTFAKALKDCPDSVLHAVSSRDVEKAQAFADEHGATRAYGSYEAMLADSEVDAVYIATLHPFHLEWIGHSVLAGKHVLCEKPLAMNLRQAKQAKKLADEKRCLIREAFMYRHHPQTQKVVDLVTSGAIGKVRMIEASFCFDSGVQLESRLQARALGGGGILDVGCYVMSFARLIAGRANDRLFAEPLELKAVGHLNHETKTDMWTSATMRFEGDVLANVKCAVRMNAENNAVIYGEKGRITAEMPWLCQGAIRVQLNGQDEAEVFESDQSRHLYSYEIEAFTAEMRGQPIGANAVGMRFDDTLGNMKALDWWRSEIGLGYEADAVR